MKYLSDACWSATRPSVFYVTKMDGSLDVWDIVFRQKFPVINVLVGGALRFLVFASRRSSIAPRVVIVIVSGSNGRTEISVWKPDK